LKTTQKIDSAAKEKTPLKQIQPKAATPNNATARPTLSKTPSKTHFKHSNLQTSASKDATTASTKRFPTASTKNTTQIDGKASSKLLNERVD